jgi:hypothetical protein
VGALGLAAVLGVSAASRQLAPAATVCAAIGIVVLGVSLRGAEKGRRQGSGMAELVNGVTLSLGAVWTASVVAGASAAADELGDWRGASTAMRFAWLAAMPLVLAAVVALAPRASATGLGISRSRAAVITTATGVILCMALSKVVLARTSPLLVAASQVDSPASIQTPSRRPVQQPEPPPASQEPVPSASSASAGAPAQVEPESVAAAGAATDAPATPEAVAEAPARATAPPLGAGGEAGQPPEVEAVGEARQQLALSHEAKQSRMSLRVTISGPMSADVARQGVAKSFKRLVPCYEGSELKAKPAAAHVRFTVSPAGGVRNVDFVGPQGAPATYVACVQLAFLRTGFQMSPDQTELDISIDFAPKN